MPELSRSKLSEMAAQAGLRVAGVARPAPFEQEQEFIKDHIDRGHTAGMDWFTKQRAEESAAPRTLHGSVRSIVSVGAPFWSGRREPPDDGILRGRIARYAWGRDYHKTLRKRMEYLVGMLSESVGRDLEARTLSDTARSFDRAIAARSGAGWFGKNSMIIVPGHGSWVMLGELYLDIDLLPDVPLDRNCGRCSICIDRCPTGAIVEPYRIDAPKCISYLTIEEKGPIPRELRPKMGNWVFGCDVCQDVCPYTGAAQILEDPDFAPASIDNVFPSLELLATMDHDRYVEVFAGTAVTRAKRRGLARNAAIALGNSGDSRAEPILRDMLSRHDEPLARSHAAWGLGQLTGSEARAILESRLRSDPSAEVRNEIRLTLDEVLV
ncbi:MAG: tRNA epoxyqueuosine(34) reductase QueG [Thermomicrobiales bacterium]